MRTSRAGLRGLCAVGVAIAVGGCSAASDDGSRTSSSELINGRAATIAEYPSTVQMNRRCTATIVGRRQVLTAAHCVMSFDEGVLDRSYEAGRTVSLRQVEFVEQSEEPVRRIAGPFALPIARTIVHPSMLAACAAPGACAESWPERTVDLAVIEIARDITQFPATAVDPTPVLSGEQIVLAGYGCSVRVPDFEAGESGDGEKQTWIRAGVASVRFGYDVSDILSSAGRSGPDSGLCPGDSGGPAYRPGTRNVVGVASRVQFDANRYPTQNSHARTDNGALNIARWLREVGVDVLRPSVARAGNKRTRGDFDGDGRTDVAIWRGATGEFWFHGANPPFSWGLAGDLPASGDYDGDGRTDPAIWRNGELWPLNTNPTMVWGQPGDLPAPADYDGDGVDEFAVWRPSTGELWIAGRPASLVWGAPGDLPAPADYDGDGVDEFAVWRPSTGQLWRYNQDFWLTWGTAGDLPAPGDYDGDGIDDFAVWRPSTGEWFVFGRGPIANWGLASYANGSPTHDRPAF